MGTFMVFAMPGSETHHMHCCADGDQDMASSENVETTNTSVSASTVAVGAVATASSGGAADDSDVGAWVVRLTWDDHT